MIRHAALLLLASCALEVGEAETVRLPVIQPLGLLTQPNEYGQYPPGALSLAQNVCLRDPGVVKALPGLQSFRDNILTADYTVRRLMTLPDSSSVLVLGTDGAGTTEMRVTGTASNTTLSPPTGLGFSPPAENMQSAHSLGRTYFTTLFGPMALESGSTTPRAAGYPPPSRLTVSAQTNTNAQALEDGKSYRWRAHFERSVSDLTMIGMVSLSLEGSNSSGSPQDKTIFVQWAANTGVVAGDTVRLYRTKGVTTGTDTGETYLLAVSYVLTSADITAGSASIRDTSPDAALGVELYTNSGLPGVGGLAGANLNNWMPPIAYDIATFKGHTFYASQELQTQFIIKVPGGWGVLTTDAQRTYGVGLRVITGDTHSNTTIDNISATDMLGLVVGQEISGTGIPADTTIATIAGAASITISQAATATAAGVTLTVTDQIEVDGVVYPISSPDGLAAQFAQLQYLVYPDKALQTNELNASAVFQRYYGTVQMPVRATNGANYSPPIPAITATAQNIFADSKGNRYHWSKENQPDAVPLLSFAFVGNGEIYRMVPTRDAMWMFCSDGLYRLSGDSGVWRTDPVDQTLTLATMTSVDVMGDVVYAYTNRGLVAISDSGIVELSADKIGDQIPGQPFQHDVPGSFETFISCDDKHKEVWMTVWDSVGEESTSYIYNVRRGAFTTMSDAEISATVYVPALEKLVFGRVDAVADLYYPRDDDLNVTMSGPDVRFQPLYMDEPAATKQFQSIEHIFQGVGATMTIVPSFDGTAYDNRSLAANTLETRVQVGVPREAPAISSRLRPGFALTTNVTSNIWTYHGCSVRFEPVSDEGKR